MRHNFCIQQIQGEKMQKNSEIKEMQLWVKWLFPVLMVLALGMCVSGKSVRAPDMNAIYPAPWSSAANSEITRALLSAGVTGCGYLEYKVSTRSRTEYLVACSRTGQSWLVYEVWPTISEVMGPYKAPDGMKMPGER